MPIARARAINRAHNRLARARSQLLAELMLALFMTLQNFASAFDDAARKTCESRDLDPVALVRAARLHVPKKNNLVRSLFHRDVDVFHRRKKFS